MEWKIGGEQNMEGRMTEKDLLPTDLLARFQEVGDQDNGDPMVVAKYFMPTGRYTFYATAYYPEDRTFFGYCISALGADCDEWGYISLDEWLETVDPDFGVGIERDLYFSEAPFKDLRKG